MKALTPGLAQSALELMRLLQRQSLGITELLAGLKRIGNMATADALDLAQTLNWLSLTTDGVLRATPAGERVVAITRYDLALRQIMLDFVDFVRPDWLQNATYGRARVLSFAGIGVAQTLVEAGVASGIDDSVVGFWDALAARARGQKDDRMLAIGRTGERLSLAYEERRTGTPARWIALDSNQDGYDILSIAAEGSHMPLTIEVKTSTIGLSGLIHLTRPEWLHALDSSAHVFHLWHLQTKDSPQLAIVSPSEMASHIPVDVGTGLWREVQIPFRTFSGRFAEATDDLRRRPLGDCAKAVR